jgi:hypothetical protein
MHDQLNQESNYTKIIDFLTDSNLNTSTNADTMVMSKTQKRNYLRKLELQRLKEQVSTQPSTNDDLKNMDNRALFTMSKQTIIVDSGMDNL